MTYGIFFILVITVIGNVCTQGSSDCSTAVTHSSCVDDKCTCDSGYYGIDDATTCEQSK